MRAKLIEVAFKFVVRYLRKHPDLIPGQVDDVVISVLAKLLGV